ncbi:fumarylacetoacetate hydrolase family protein [Pimelobacter simplex]|uniref:Fumarylacetoacetate hydrolase family protein n=1 Tax=Nocardioides simplex TaxID=2045 RepID=A0A7J5DSG1_NOCSI|nr:fumarylacetoacetate hydrolase family protein [Pimelobacter simplex]KAB2807834.1 fumarylacetoacetate hydrolase family protein [Pimelobacter simplex]
MTGPQTNDTRLRVVGDDEPFYVRRIYCVGRNYVDHIREMKEGDERDDPFFFQKPTDAVVPHGGEVPYPPATDALEFEGELVVAVGKPLSGGSTADALDAVFGYAAGIDMTRRDRQRECREQMRPWEAGKSFDHSAPCGDITRVQDAGHVPAAELRLLVNGDVRQRTSTDLMIWNVPEVIAQLSRQYRLEPGDLIYTGTPAGVGTVGPGDVIEVEIDGLAALTTTITEGASR